MKHFIVAGNHKMNVAEGRWPMDDSKQPLRKERGFGGEFSNVQIVVCPPYHLISKTVYACEGTGVEVGAQNCHQEAKGAYTGEISAPMISELGCKWVIVGHSERRRDQFEGNELIGRKAGAAVAAGLRPIICIGETLAERQGDKATEVVLSQIDEILESCGKLVFDASVLAYEPVWAIGTGISATPEQAEEMHAVIREHCRKRNALDVPILYGGSVTPENALDLFKCKHIDGALVGGASLKSESFSAIVDAARQCSHL